MTVEKSKWTERKLTSGKGWPIAGLVVAKTKSFGLTIGKRSCEVGRRVSAAFLGSARASGVPWPPEQSWEYESCGSRWSPPKCRARSLHAFNSVGAQTLSSLVRLAGFETTRTILSEELGEPGPVALGSSDREGREPLLCDRLDLVGQVIRRREAEELVGGEGGRKCDEGGHGQSWAGAGAGGKQGRASSALARSFTRSGKRAEAKSAGGTRQPGNAWPAESGRFKAAWLACTQRSTAESGSARRAQAAGSVPFQINVWVLL